MKKVNLLGQRFERLLAVSGPVMVANGTASQSAWHCICDCGNRSLVAAYKLRSGRSKSCGCLVVDVRRQYMKEHPKPKRHGHSHSPTYRSWYAMIQRCTNLKNIAFEYYGARGVQVCERWKLFDNYLSDMGERPPGKTMDRIDVNGNYEASNCRWATATEQARNKRNSKSFSLEN